MSNPSTTTTQDFLDAIKSIKTHEPGAMQQIARIIEQFDIKPDENSERSGKIQNLIIEAHKHHIRRHNILFGENGEKKARAQKIQSSDAAVSFAKRPITQITTKPQANLLPQNQTTSSNPEPKEQPKAEELPSTEHAERLERVNEMIGDLKTLNELLTNLQMRATSLVASTPTDGPREAVKLWDEAVGKIKTSLNRLIQISDDDNPISLLNTKHKLENMVALFEENAAGAEGIGLQEDENRLKNFESRLESIDPPVTELIKSINETLAEKTLQAQYLQEESKQLEQVYEEDRKRVSKINSRIQELKGGLTNRTRRIQKDLENFRTKLDTVVNDSSLDTDLVELGKKWLSSVDQSLQKFPTEQNVADLVDWAEKFKGDKTFTELKLRNRIRKDLIRQLVAAEKTIGIQKSRYSPQKLLDEANRRRMKAIDDLKSIVAKTGDQARKLYQDLIVLRRAKMGENFDERFSGPVAQDVSNLIEDIADFEVRLIKFSGEVNILTKLEDGFKTKAQEFQAELKQLSGRSQTFLDTNKLEELLSKQLIAILQPLRTKTKLIFEAINNLKTVKSEIQTLPATKPYTDQLDKVIIAGEELGNSIEKFVSVSLKGEAKTGIKEEIEKTARVIDNFTQKASLISKKEAFFEKLIRKFANDLGNKESELAGMEAKLTTAYENHENFANQISARIADLKQEVSQKINQQKQQSRETLVKLQQEFSKVDTDLSAIYESNLEKSLRTALGKVQTWIEKEADEIERLQTNKITLSPAEMRSWLEDLEARKANKEFVEAKYFNLKDALSKEKPSQTKAMFLSTFEEINKKAGGLNLPEKFDVSLPFDQSKIDSFRAAFNSALAQENVPVNS